MSQNGNSDVLINPRPTEKCCTRAQRRYAQELSVFTFIKSPENNTWLLQYNHTDLNTLQTVGRNLIFCFL